MATLRRRSDDAEPELSGGALLLDAESEWVVEGSAEEIGAVLASLGLGVCRRVSSRVLLLRFGNNVGRVGKAGPLGPLLVRSGKWGEADYDALLEDLSRVTAALPFASTAPSSLPYERTELDARDVLYHAFVWLRHSLLREHNSELHDAVHGILRSPHRRLVRTSREVPVELAGRLRARTLDDIASGRWTMAENPLGFPVGGRRVLPTRVEEEIARESADTAENRFVKAFLADCAWVVDRVRRELGGGEDSFARRVRADCAALAEVLVRWLRAPLWREVGIMAHFPASSTVLQRRSEYRTVLRHQQMLRLGSRVPLDPETSLKLLESKDIATLYEMWAAFAVLGVVRDLLGQPAHTARVVVGQKGASVSWGLVARWPDGTELAYNHTFTRDGGFHGCSRSLRLRPDVALFVPAGSSAGLHLFDAKFRLEGTLDADEDDTTYKHGDLHKMHAYRDAIRSARSAWVLYPGNEDAAFFDDGRRGLGAVNAAEIAGVGALPLRPGLAQTAIRAVITTILATESSEASHPVVTA
ncbi:MAG: DUF2357 domain-containing protein [Pseudomonadota bacterium]|nr:DUF2357 domain-containing protein [Pseudomonadota bacterium]